MRGNEFLRKQEQASAGFLRRAYGSRPFTDASDTEVAALLSLMAELHGATVTADVIGKERLRLGMRRCKVERKPRAIPVEAEAAAVEPKPFDAARFAAEVLEGVGQPAQPALPGVELEGRGVWALYREMRELKAAIIVLTKTLAKERAA